MIEGAFLLPAEKESVMNLVLLVLVREIANGLLTGMENAGLQALKPFLSDVDVRSDYDFLLLPLSLTAAANFLHQVHDVAVIEVGDDGPEVLAIDSLAVRIPVLWEVVADVRNDLALAPSSLHRELRPVRYVHHRHCGP